MPLVTRAKEACRLVLRHAADWRSRWTMLGCYAAITRDWRDPTEVEFRLLIEGDVGPFRMRRCDLFTLAEILHEGQYEPVRLELPERPIIVDAGANIGVATRWLLARHPGARVVAFEPDPDNARLLRENTRGRHVTVEEVALGDRNEEVILYRGDHDAVHSIVAGAAGETGSTVRCVRLDRWLETSGIERVDLLKLDVEGAEERVLDGLGERIADVGAIIGELHHAFVDEVRFDRRLGEAGFVRTARATFGDPDVHASEYIRAPAAEGGAV